MIATGPKRGGRGLGMERQAVMTQEILHHLAAEDRVELEVTIEIHARRPGGRSEERMRTVNENARVPKFEQ